MKAKMKLRLVGSLLAILLSVSTFYLLAFFALSYRLETSNQLVFMIAVLGVVIIFTATLLAHKQALVVGLVVALLAQFVLLFMYSGGIQFKGGEAKSQYPDLPRDDFHTRLETVPCENGYLAINANSYREYRIVWYSDERADKPIMICSEKSAYLENRGRCSALVEGKVPQVLNCRNDRYSDTTEVIKTYYDAAKPSSVPVVPEPPVTAR